MDEIANSSDLGRQHYITTLNLKRMYCCNLVDGWQNIWESLESIIAEDHSPRKTFVSVLMKTLKMRKKTWSL